MAITKAELKKLSAIDKVIIHSHDLSVYLVSVMMSGEEHYIVDKTGKPIRAFSKLELQTMFEKHDVGEMVLRQESAYDEMIGQPVREGENTMEVRLGNKAMGGLLLQAPLLH